MILLDLAIQQEQTEEYISIDGYSIWRLRHTEYAYYYIPVGFHSLYLQNTVVERQNPYCH